MDGFAIDGGHDADEQRSMVDRLTRRREGCPIWALAPALQKGKRQAPELASLDQDESAAAVAAAERAILLAGDVGADFVVLSLGEVTAVRASWGRVRRLFRRGELDGGALGELLAERTREAPRHVDGIRRGLERLAHVAAASGVRLAIPNPRRPIGLPSPAEIGFIMGDFAGAPLVPLWDVMASYLLDLFYVSFETTALAWAGAPLAYWGDACAAVAGLGPGRGEIDLAAAARHLDAASRLVFVPWSGLAAGEACAALAALRTQLALG